jgi:hypothetical protein
MSTIRADTGLYSAQHLHQRRAHPQGLSARHVNPSSERGVKLGLGTSGHKQIDGNQDGPMFDVDTLGQKFCIGHESLNILNEQPLDIVMNKPTKIPSNGIGKRAQKTLSAGIASIVPRDEQPEMTSLDRYRAAAMKKKKSNYLKQAASLVLLSISLHGSSSRNLGASNSENMGVDMKNDSETSLTTDDATKQAVSNQADRPLALSRLARKISSSQHDNDNDREDDDEESLGDIANIFMQDSLQESIEPMNSLTRLGRKTHSTPSLNFDDIEQNRKMEAQHNMSIRKLWNKAIKASTHISMSQRDKGRDNKPTTELHVPRDSTMSTGLDEKLFNNSGSGSGSVIDERKVMEWLHQRAANQASGSSPTSIGMASCQVNEERQSREADDDVNIKRQKALQGLTKLGLEKSTRAGVFNQSRMKQNPSKRSSSEREASRNRSLASKSEENRIQTRHDEREISRNSSNRPPPRSKSASDIGEAKKSTHTNAKSIVAGWGGNSLSLISSLLKEKDSGCYTGLNDSASFYDETVELKSDEIGYETTHRGKIVVGVTLASKCGNDSAPNKGETNRKVGSHGEAPGQCNAPSARQVASETIPFITTRRRSLSSGRRRSRSSSNVLEVDDESGLRRQSLSSGRRRSRSNSNGLEVDNESGQRQRSFSSGRRRSRSSSNVLEVEDESGLRRQSLSSGRRQSRSSSNGPEVDNESGQRRRPLSTGRHRSRSSSSNLEVEDESGQRRRSLSSGRRQRRCISSGLEGDDESGQHQHQRSLSSGQRESRSSCDFLEVIESSIPYRRSLSSGRRRLGSSRHSPKEDELDKGECRSLSSSRHGLDRKDENVHELRRSLSSGRLHADTRRRRLKGDGMENNKEWESNSNHSPVSGVLDWHGR